MGSFEQMATVTASTKRSGGVVDGLDSGYAENIASLKCLPLDPVSAELGQGISGLGFRELLQTSVKGDLDIKEGDLLVVGSTEYPVRAVEDWEWKDDTFRVLYLADLK